jgi:hypothetical protein
MPKRRLAAERWASAAAKLAVVTLDIEADQARFGIAIPLERFGLLAIEHFQRVLRTTEIEDQARHLIDDDFPENDAVRFLKDVCGWGGYAGIAGRVVHRNEPVNIRNALLTAARQLLVAEPDPAKALMAVNRLKGLGRPSFASKQT